MLIELTNWRWTWRTMIVLGMLTPLGGIVVLKMLMRDATHGELAYILAGNTVLSVIFENQHRVAGHIVFMRGHGTLDYFSSLPVRKSTLLLAIIAAFLLLSLPAFLVTVAAGAVVLGLPLHPSPLLVLVLPIVALPMAGVGALIGVLARSGPEANSLGILATFAMAGLGAVILPPDRVPDWLEQLGRLSPATYASAALRQVIIGPVTSSLIWHLCALLAIAAVVFWVAGRKLDWRQA